MLPGGELDEGADDPLTQIRGYRSPDHESVRQTRGVGLHPRPLSARRRVPTKRASWMVFFDPCGSHRKAALRRLNRPLPTARARRSGPKVIYHPAEVLPEAFKQRLLGISPAQIVRRLRPVRVQPPKKGLSATRPGPRLRHAVPTRAPDRPTRRARAPSRPTPWPIATTRPKAIT